MFKYFIFLLLLSFNLSAGDWSEEDQQRQLALTALRVIDWGQTLDIIESPDVHERNLLLGENPSRGKVNTYMSALIVGEWALAKHFSPQNRKKYQWVMIAVESLVVISNHRLGVRINF